jgi:hypothetical protein
LVTLAIRKVGVLKGETCRACMRVDQHRKF